MSGIREASLDGIPMLFISGGIRRDTDHHYQLHDMDMGRVLDGLIKQYTLVEDYDEVVPSIHDAYRTVHDGEPGLVFVEIPTEIQLFRGAVDETTRLAEELVAPTTTTLQSKNAVPVRHALTTCTNGHRWSCPRMWRTTPRTDGLAYRISRRPRVLRILREIGGRIHEWACFPLRQLHTPNPEHRAPRLLEFLDEVASVRNSKILLAAPRHSFLLEDLLDGLLRIHNHDFDAVCVCYAAGVSSGQ